MSEKDIRLLATTVERQKADLLSKSSGGFTPVPHGLFRNVMPELLAKYPGRDVRDAMILYMYLQAYVCGKKDDKYYMWAFPDFEQIRIDTGIHGNRIKKITDILVDEGLLYTKLIPWKGNCKRVYLPYYKRIKTVEQVETFVKDDKKLESEVCNDLYDFIANLL